MPIQISISNAIKGQVMAADNLLLDLYPNAALAYSFRKLSSSFNGSPIRVRRSSDNAEQDIPFDGSGDLDTANLLAFVGSNDGFICDWYDQSGNITPLQTVQPIKLRLFHRELLKLIIQMVNLHLCGQLISMI